jgi:uncharacterized protein
MDTAQQPNTIQRIELVDIIRGFALLGIFFVNIPDMWGKGYYFVSEYVGSDAFVRLLYDMFIQTKFYTLFSFLFGLSFYFFMQSTAQRGLKPKRLMARRLALLLIFGGLHFFFVWFGDILMSYAVIGFLLLLFYGRKAKTILIWSLILLAISFLILPLSYYMASITNPDLLNMVLFESVPGWSARVDFFMNYGIAGIISYIPEILGLFLLGLYAGMKGWFTTQGLSDRMLARAQWISLLLTVIIFIPMILNYVSTEVYEPALIYHFTYLSGKTLAVFYLVTFVRVVRAWGAMRFHGLAALGRMAFTNYLTQSIVTMLLLHFVFQQASTWPLWTYTLYAILFLSVQMAWSVWWLNRYRMGPLEWLWRKGTYGAHLTVK